MKKSIASVDVGDATVDAVLQRAVVRPGEAVDVVVSVEGAEGVRSVGEVAFELETRCRGETGAETVTVDRRRPGDGRSLEPGASATVERTLRLPYATPLTMDGVPVWVDAEFGESVVTGPGDSATAASTDSATAASTDSATGTPTDSATTPSTDTAAVDTRDGGETGDGDGTGERLSVRPTARMETVFDATDALNLSLRGVECEADPYGRYVDRRHVQVFDFHPVGGPFDDAFDRLSLVFDPAPEALTVYAELDRRPDLLSALALADERKTRFALPETDADAARRQLRQTVERLL